MTKHLIIGTGPIGAGVARHLTAAGHDVTAINRSGKRGTLDAATPLLTGDVHDAAFMASALDGVDVVYQCAQPPYHRWAEEFPALQRAVLDAAAAAGAKVVLADNLYGYGPPRGDVITEDTPQRPTTRKGQVRAAMDEEALADDRVQVALTRPANYVGADYAIFRGMVIDQLAKGKPAQVLGRLDQLHSFSYTDDAARAMAMIGASDTGWGRAWITPTMEPLTQQELLDRVAAALGQPTPAKARALRGALLSVVGLFAPPVRESKEMIYEFDEPFVASSEQFQATFGFGPTSWDDAIAAMVAQVRTG